MPSIRSSLLMHATLVAQINRSTGRFEKNMPLGLTLRGYFYKTNIKYKYLASINRRTIEHPIVIHIETYQPGECDVEMYSPSQNTHMCILAYTYFSFFYTNIGEGGNETSHRNLSPSKGAKRKP